MKNLNLFLAVLVLNIFSSFSQNLGTITGEIFDAKSQFPVTGANIILDGTTIGTISDENGCSDPEVGCTGYTYGLTGETPAVEGCVVSQMQGITQRCRNVVACEGS